MISMKCSKCGYDSARVFYDKTVEQLRLVCNTCGYTWYKQTLDTVVPRIDEDALDEQLDNAREVHKRIARNEELEKLWRHECEQPHLGYATTGEVLDEIRTRIEIHGPGLGYRTVGGEDYVRGARATRTHT